MFPGSLQSTRQSQLYETNARIFLERLSRKHGRRLTLGTVPREEWQSLASLGFDFIWLMGVWQRSPGARQRALTSSEAHGEYDRALPGWTEADVEGSPYAVYSYHPDPVLGSDDDLARLRANLHSVGMKLILDFVPNHLALDNPWVSANPDWFVAVGEAEASQHPDRYFSPREGIFLAHGRDPNFPPWTDTAQVNISSPGMRSALTDVLLRIADVADGVRCDMAMLVLNEVFERVWGRSLKYRPYPRSEFWLEAVCCVKQKRPDFVFIGETYWGYDQRLLRLGFDYTYDKPLYDVLRGQDVPSIRKYLAGTECLSRLVHFIENHDEPRAVTAFGRERSLAAAVIAFTVPGMRLVHDGQSEGRRTRLPVQLVREPEEVRDTTAHEFYERLLRITGEPVFRTGKWRLLGLAPAWDGNRSHENILAWLWTDSQEHRVVVVNYSWSPAQGRVTFLLPSGAGEQVTLNDQLNGEEYLREYSELADNGLYIALEPYQSHIFKVTV